MKTFRHSINIGRPIDEVYALAKQVERYPQFMKDYLTSKIIERRADGDLIERSSLVKGKLYSWKSLATYSENEGVYFVHQEGPLHGMKVSWRLTPQSSDTTVLTITHQLNVQRALPGVGWLLERFYYAPRIQDIASRVVVAFKEACERREGVHA
jgi:coenzyme Q-binding protein COQ10